MKCVLCKNLIECEDDIGARTPGGRLICLACWDRDTADERRMDPHLRREVQDVIKGL
jgi:hypothetical protein